MIQRAFKSGEVTRSVTVWHPHAERGNDHSPTYLRSPLIPGGAEIH
jgi:hypothetical protein